MGIDYDSDAIYGWSIVLGDDPLPTGDSKEKDFVKFLVKNNMIPEESNDLMSDDENEFPIFEVVDNFSDKDNDFDLMVVGDHFSSYFCLLVGIKLDGKDLDYLNTTLDKIKESWNLLEDFFNEKPEFISSYSIY